MRCYGFNLKLLPPVFGTLMLAISAPLYALTFSDVRVLSQLGENFVAQVDFSLAANEVADEACFHVTSTGSDVLDNLPANTLTVVPTNQGGRLRIRTTQPLNEPVVRFTVRASCPALGQLQREYTVLLDPPNLVDPPNGVDPPTLALPDVSPPAVSQAPTTSGHSGSATATKSSAASATLPRRPKSQQRAGNPAPWRPLTAAAKGGPASGFRLKLSTNEIDLSRSEKMTERDRAELREKQLLMDADDQVANMLSLKNSVKQLETRLAEMQQKLNVVSTPAAVASLPAPAPVGKTAAASAAPVALAPDKSSMAPASTLDWVRQHWYWGLAALLLLILAAVYWRRRQHDESFAYPLNDAAPLNDTGNTPEPAHGSSTESLVDLDFHGETPAPGQPTAWQETPADPHDLYRNVIVNQFPELKLAGGADPAVIVDVAWKYFEDNSERGRAIELMEFGLEEHPEDEDLWLTQFEFYRRDGRRGAYEQLAKRYLKSFPDSASWDSIREGGRFLDPTNWLYADEEFSDDEKSLALDFDITGDGDASPENAEAAENEKNESPIADAELLLPLDFTPEVEPTVDLTKPDHGASRRRGKK